MTHHFNQQSPRLRFPIAALLLVSLIFAQAEAGVAVAVAVAVTLKKTIVSDNAVNLDTCTSDHRLFQFEKRQDCLIAHTTTEPLPPPDCPRSPQSSSGLIFRNVYLIDQKNFGWYADNEHDIALLAPPPNITDGVPGRVPRSNGPFTILPDPASGAVSFNLQSMKVACRFYENAAKFIDLDNPYNCTVDISCDIGSPRRAVAQTFFVYDPADYQEDNKHWAVANSKVWEFVAEFVELAKCELSVMPVAVEGWDADWRIDGTHFAVMVDDMAVVVTRC